MGIALLAGAALTAGTTYYGTTEAKKGAKGAAKAARREQKRVDAVLSEREAKELNIPDIDLLKQVGDFKPELFEFFRQLEGGGGDFRTRLGSLFSADSEATLEALPAAERASLAKGEAGNRVAQASLNAAGLGQGLRDYREGLAAFLRFDTPDGLQQAVARQATDYAYQSGVTGLANVGVAHQLSYDQHRQNFFAAGQALESQVGLQQRIAPFGLDQSLLPQGGTSFALDQQNLQTRNQAAAQNYQLRLTQATQNYQNRVNQIIQNLNRGDEFAKLKANVAGDRASAYTQSANAYSAQSAQILGEGLKGTIELLGRAGSAYANRNNTPGTVKAPLAPADTNYSGSFTDYSAFSNAGRPAGSPNVDYGDPYNFGNTK